MNTTRQTGQQCLRMRYYDPSIREYIFILTRYSICSINSACLEYASFMMG